MAASKKKVLSMWQARHGLLANDSLREEFLHREETAKIAAYPVHWIRLSLAHEKQLDEILKVLSWRAAMKFRYEGFLRSHGVQPITDSKQNVQSSRPVKLRITPGAVAGLDVVGESFYKKSFDSLREQFGATDDSRFAINAELRLDPGNEFSKSGKAVKVMVEGLQVGHVPERIAPGLFDLIAPMGDRAYIPGEIWFDAVASEPQRNSVRISVSPTASKPDNVRQERPIRSGRPTQAEEDARKWRESHPLSASWTEESETKPKFDGGGEVKKKSPVLMKYYCTRCQGDAGTAKEMCFECDSTADIPRLGRKSLEASRGAKADELAASRAVPLEIVMAKVAAKRERRNKAKAAIALTGDVETQLSRDARRQIAAERRRQAEEETRRLKVENSGPKQLPEFEAPPAQPYGVSAEGAETLAADWMKHLGALDVRVTRFTNDGGVDVVSRNHVAQVKHQMGSVGRPEIQQITGIAAVEKKQAVFFTTARYSYEAQSFADESRVGLFVMNPEEGTLQATNQAASNLFPFSHLLK